MKILDGCQGKAALPNAEVAQERVKAMRSRDVTDVRHYHCKHCGKWHIGGIRGRGQDLKAADYKRRKRALREGR